MGRVYALFANGIAGPSLVDRLDGEDAVRRGGRVLGVHVEDAEAPKVAAGKERVTGLPVGNGRVEDAGVGGLAVRVDDEVPDAERRSSRATGPRCARCSGVERRGFDVAKARTRRELVQLGRARRSLTSHRRV